MGREGEEGDFNTLVLQLTNDAQSGVKGLRRVRGGKGQQPQGAEQGLEELYLCDWCELYK